MICSYCVQCGCSTCSLGWKVEKNRKLARGHFNQPSHKGFGCNLLFIRYFSNTRLKQTHRLFTWYSQILFQSKYLADGVINPEKQWNTIPSKNKIIYKHTSYISVLKWHNIDHNWNTPKTNIKNNWILNNNQMISNVYQCTMHGHLPVQTLWSNLQLSSATTSLASPAQGFKGRFRVLVFGAMSTNGYLHAFEVNWILEMIPG